MVLILVAVAALLGGFMLGKLVSGPRKLDPAARKRLAELENLQMNLASQAIQNAPHEPFAAIVLDEINTTNRKALEK